jgi:NAD(P)-dependent dehydrogenase (short-subunit alcohol dehydrogenase family)
MTSAPSALPDLARWMRLDGRAALVTGAGAGIGRAIALALAAQGARVTALDRDTAAAARTVSAIAAAGGAATALACDIADEEGIAREVGAIAAAGLDIVVNSAGVTSPPGMPFTNNRGADWDRAFDINVKGAFYVCKAAAAALQACGRGRIVNVSSITGVISAAYMPPYSVSKAALISLTKVLARDFAAAGVAVNAICPGFVWTPLWETLGEEMARASGGAQGADAQAVFDARIRQHVPMARPQSAGEVAALAAFLCADAAANITGQVIGVDGGVTI